MRVMRLTTFPIIRSCPQNVHTYTRAHTQLDRTDFDYSYISNGCLFQQQATNLDRIQSPNQLVNPKPIQPAKKQTNDAVGMIPVADRVFD